MNDQSFDGTCPTCGQPYLREAQAAAKASHAELESLKARVTHLLSQCFSGHQLDADQVRRLLGG